MWPIILDQVRKTVVDLDFNPTALAFAITLGARESYYFGRAEGEDYWGSECANTIEHFWDRIDPLCRTHPWFAAHIYKYSKFPLSKVLEWHGASVLFNVTALAGSREENLFTHVLYGGEPFADEAIPAEAEEFRLARATLADYLVGSSTPWAHSTQFHRWMHDELEPCPEDKNRLFLSILNIMLGGQRLKNVVLKDRQRFPRDSRGAIYRDVWRAKEGSLSESRLRSRLAILPEDQIDFISRWAANEFDLLSLPR